MTDASRRLARLDDNRVAVVVDAAMLLLAVVVAGRAAPAAGVSGGGSGWAVAFAPLTLVLLEMRGAYRPRTAPAFLDDVRVIVETSAIAAVAITFVALQVTGDADSGAHTVRAWPFAVVYMIAGRGGIHLARERQRRLGGGRRTLILGAGMVGNLLAARLLSKPEIGLRPVGFLDDDPHQEAQLDVAPVLGGSEDLTRVVSEHRIQHALVSFSTAPHDVELRMAQKLEELGVSVSVVPRLFEGIPDRVTLERVEGLPLLTVYPSNPKGWQVSLKYASDRVIALIAIVLASPLLLAAALGTAATVGRPVLFRQRRVGLDGHEFEMLKFRTMRVAAGEEQRRASRQAQRAIEGGLAPGGEEGAERVTRFGAFLRGLSLDELPQLLNVLRGEMSIVGPRPERTSYVPMFEQRIRRYGDRHKVKAGITGWAQVHGLRGNTSLADRIEWDNYYIENWSPWLDFKILLMTVLDLVRRLWSLAR